VRNPAASSRPDLGVTRKFGIAIAKFSNVSDKSKSAHRTTHYTKPQSFGGTGNAMA
jgi:hypothetical protein